MTQKRDDVELKADRCDYECEDCNRFFHTEDGLRFHNDRIHE